MGLFHEFARRAQSIIGPVVGVVVAMYFAYHVVQGDRGLLARRALQDRVETARAELSELHAKRLEMENRVRLLSPATLDPDMADERARYMLNLALSDEVVIMLPEGAGAEKPE